MKRRIRTLCLLAGLALAGGVLWSAQGKTVNGQVYDVNFALQNATTICAVYGLPQLDIANGSVDVLDYSVDVDGAGKITGFAQVQLSSDAGTSVVMTKVTGKMGMKGNVPVANMTIKGPGYSTTGTTAGKANLNAKFVGSPVYLSGESSYYDQYEMSGTVNGSFNVGIKGASTVKIKNAAGTISSYDVAGMTQINSCILSMVVVNNKLTLGGCLQPGDGNLDFHYEWNGTGNVNTKSGKFNFALKGTGPVDGSTITLKGVGVPDNPDDPASAVSLNSLTATGKVMGQKVSAVGDGYLEVQ